MEHELYYVKSPFQTNWIVICSVRSWLRLAVYPLSLSKASSLTGRKSKDKHSPSLLRWSGFFSQVDRAYWSRTHWAVVVVFLFNPTLKHPTWWIGLFSVNTIPAGFFFSFILWIHPFFWLLARCNLTSASRYTVMYCSCVAEIQERKDTDCFTFNTVLNRISSTLFYFKLKVTSGDIIYFSFTPWL